MNTGTLIAKKRIAYAEQKCTGVFHTGFSVVRKVILKQLPMSQVDVGQHNLAKSNIGFETYHFLVAWGSDLSHAHGGV